MAAQPDPPLVQLDDLVFIGAHSARQAFDGQSFMAEGDLRLRSRKWTIHADNARLSGPLGDPDLIRVEGRPARIVFDRGAGREPLEGRSSLLEFEPARDVLRLEGDARIVRGQQSISSDSIRYLVDRDTFAAGESGRVRVVTKPR